VKILSRFELVTLSGIGVLTAGSVALLPQAYWPKCPIYLVTGFFCPGCGGLRATDSLIHGDLAGALDQNFLILLIPILVLAAFWLQNGKNRNIEKWFVISVVSMSIGFAILRNVPGSWLAPN